jgi:hypothetical protein
MPAAPAGAPAGQQNAAAVPFLAGTWDYSEVLATDLITMGAQTDFSHNITPGGFLRGITFIVTSLSGAAAGQVLQGDAPFSIIYSMTLESIDGTPILYPMNGFSYFLVSRWCRPWDGDPVGDPGYSASANPTFRMRFFTEGRLTIGVLPNTDARAQYRIRYTIAPLLSSDGITGLYVAAATGQTAPALTIMLAFEAYAQPPAADYSGNPIVQIPDGLALQRFNSHQAGDLLNTGLATIKENRVGNLIRTLILVVRTSTGQRYDLTADPIRWRIDNTQLLIENRSRRDFEDNRFGKQQNASLNVSAPQGAGAQAGTYSTVGATTTTTQPGTTGVNGQARPAGVYVYFRYHNPGQMDGNYWLETTEASYLQFELNGGQSGGTLETITEDLAPAGPVPSYLQGI